MLKGWQVSPSFRVVLTGVLPRESLRTAFTTSHAKNDGKSSRNHPEFDVNEIKTVSELFDTSVDLYTHKDLFRHAEGNERFTYLEVQTHANALARGLVSGRVFPKKRLSVSLRNDSENFITRLAATKVGIHVAHMDINNLTPELILNRFDQLQPRSFLTNGELKLRKVMDMYDEAIPEISENHAGNPLRLRRFPDLKLAIQTTREHHIWGWTALKDVFLYDPLPDPLPKLQKSVLPDTVTETHFSRFHQQQESSEKLYSFHSRSIAQAALQFGRVAESLQDKRVSFTGNLWQPEVQSAVLACVAFGAYVVYPSYFFRADTYLQELRKEYVQVLVTSASHLRELLASQRLASQPLHLESVLVLNTPGDFADAELLQSAFDKLKVEKIEVSFTVDGTNAPFLHSTVTPKTLQSATGLLGEPVPLSEARIVDSAGKPVPVGSSGRLFTKGEHVFSRYFNESASVSDVKSKDGWLNCGVDATMDAKGNFFLSKQ